MKAIKLPLEPASKSNSLFNFVADFLNINDVLAHLEDKPGMIAVEFGCGSADFAQALAKKVHKGRVYAIDSDEQKLSALKSKLTLHKLNNIVTIACDLEDPEATGLMPHSCDIVVIPNLLFQAENKRGIISEANRILKSQGQCLIVEWLKHGPIGPRENIFLPDEAKALVKEAGFSLKKEFGAGDYHYALLLIKN
jgi:ubiquinone/menaquinone biosynthesis C-methylase UbiE